MATVPLRLYDDLSEMPTAGERFLIPGYGLGAVIEAQLDTAKASARASLGHPPIGVVCHPHPLHGGTLTNKVAHTVAKTFAELGVETLRFNFRGVGESQGEFDHGVGEVEDLQAAVNWMREHYPGAPLWLAGFSFGAYVALSGHKQATADRLLLVAPPVAMFKFPADAGVEIPWCVIQGSDDEIVESSQVISWAKRQPRVPEIYEMEGSGHFFHGRLITLKENIGAAWGNAL
ncbi:MAG: alpha/beta hydrolase [Ectothiorhodospiraceae bacterium]|nr:alpha/beta hydrolase [Ectothiorhodospiraceae bacterium]